VHGVGFAQPKLEHGLRLRRHLGLRPPCSALEVTGLSSFAIARCANFKRRAISFFTSHLRARALAAAFMDGLRLI